MHYSTEARDVIFVKGCRFSSFAKNMGKNLGKNISKILSGKHRQKLLDHAKKSSTGEIDAVSKRVIQKTAEATNDLIGNKTADKITSLEKFTTNQF